MAKFYSTLSFFSFKAISILLLITGISFYANAQTYYSQFSDAQAASHVQTVAPSGGICLAPGITNQTRIANNSLTDFSRIEAILSVPLTCTNTKYSFKADLNIGALTSLQGGYIAGFKLKTSAAIDLALLGSSITLNTYLNGAPAESKTGNGLLGLNFLSLNADGNVYFLTTQPFNSVELVLSNALIEVGVLFRIDVYYAFAQPNTVLPVSLTNFKAIINGNTASLAWTALGEVGINRYEIERSGADKVYKKVGTVAATADKSATKNYQFTDLLSLKGGYTYRLKIFNNDGSFYYSDEVFINYQLLSKMLVYPSVLKAGAPLWIQTEASGKLQIQVYDLQGKQVYKNTINSTGLTSIGTAKFNAGTYVIQVTTLSGETYKQMFFTNN